MLLVALRDPSICLCDVSMTGADLLLPVSSPSSATNGVVTFTGLRRSLLSGVGEGTLGRSFCIIEQAEFETPRGSSGHELDYP